MDLSISSIAIPEKILQPFASSQQKGHICVGGMVVVGGGGAGFPEHTNNTKKW